MSTLEMVLGPLPISLIVALVMTPLVRRLGHRHDVLDHPNERSSHDQPTPRGGGLAILAGVAAAAIVTGRSIDPGLIAILGLGSVVAAMGFVDDLRSLPANVKLAIQAATGTAAIVVADLILRSIRLPFIGDPQLPFSLAFGVTLFWLVGATNAYNFMDGVNGIASVEAVACAMAYAMLFTAHGDAGGAALCLGIAGGAAGFLVYNASGSIFMGDVGSGALGFLFAALALRLTNLDVPFLVTILPLLPFLLDTSTTLLKRGLRRERLFSAHRSHYYQRLTELGLSHFEVSTIYGALAIACSVVAVFWKSFSTAGLVSVVLSLVALMVLLAVVIELRIRDRQA